MSDRKRVFKPPWKITRNMFLSEEEVAGLLRRPRTLRDGGPRHAALAARDRLIVEALLFSGLRNGELCSLRVDDTIVGTGQSVFLVRGTPRQDRTVHVPQSLSQLVKDFVHVHRGHLVRSKPSEAPPIDALVVNDRGKAYDRTSLYRRIVGILASASLGGRATAQRLRHTYGYLAYKRSGGNLLFVQRQMGHAHPMVTSVYAQFVEEDYSKIADRLGQPAATPGHEAPPRRHLRKDNSDARRRKNPQPRASRRR
jgi:integrase/recombinase XerD